MLFCKSDEGVIPYKIIGYYTNGLGECLFG